MPSPDPEAHLHMLCNVACAVPVAPNYVDWEDLRRELLDPTLPQAVHKLAAAIACMLGSRFGLESRCLFRRAYKQRGPRIWFPVVDRTRDEALSAWWDAHAQDCPCGDHTGYLFAGRCAACRRLAGRCPSCGACIMDCEHFEGAP